MKKAYLILSTWLLVLSMLLASCTAPVSVTDSGGETKDTADSSQPSGNDSTQDQNTNTDDNTTTPPAEDEKVKTIFDIQKTDGTKIKIACVGDSITAGTGITDKANDSYPARLGKLLGDKYEVGNFGRGGSYILPADSPYNKREDKTLSYRDTQQYKDSLAFSPDIVILMLGANDMLGSMVSTEAAEVIRLEYEKIINNYKELESVKRVYVASSILAVNNVGANMLSDGTIQRLQKQAAKNTGTEYIDVYSLTREYYDTMLHTSDRLHPNDRCTEVLPSAMYSVLTGTEYTPVKAPSAEGKVVYVSGTGKLTNDGLSPQTAVNSLPLAAGMLRESGGTIVICGKYTCYKQSATLMPKTNGTIKITSVYGGTDYRQTSSAKIDLTSTYLYLGGDMIFDEVTVNSIAASIIVCNYNNVTFGENVTCTTDGNIAFPIILSGMNVANGAIDKEAVSLSGECAITVNGGTWGYIRNGNRRALGTSTIGEIAKGAGLTFTVNGGEIMTVATQNINAATGMNNVHGNVTFVINGGVFYGNFHAVCRMGTNSTSDRAIVDGTVSIIVNGGEIKGSLTKTQDTSFDTASAGITLTVKAEAKDKISSIIGFDSVTETD